jgi:hypothetical protein
MINKKVTKPEESPLNVWFYVLDQLLEQKISMTNAMLLAAQKIHQKQKHGNTLFDPLELQMATDDIKHLLKSRPENRPKNNQK